jgi:uncharacterized protein GlcG (DUF336 family)
MHKLCNRSLHTIIKEVDVLTYAEADALVRAGFAKAIERKYLITVVVVDETGHMIALGRMDGCRWLAPEIAKAKALATTHFKRSTFELEQNAQRKPAFFNSFSHMNAGTFAFSQGGLPIWRDGDVIGGIGVSGTTAAGDEQVAMAALEALGFPTSTPADGKAAVEGMSEIVEDE